MRFCPFCSAENADESAVCASCGRRLPPLPPRRAGSKGQPTGVILPQRPPTPSGTPPPTRKPPTLPPPMPSAAPHPGVIAPTTPPAADPTILRDPTTITRESAPALPPPPATDDGWGSNDSSSLAQLRNAIAPGPAAERRDALPAEPRAGSDPARRKHDSRVPPPTPARSNGSGPMQPLPTTGSPPPPGGRRSAAPPGCRARWPRARGR